MTYVEIIYISYDLADIFVIFGKLNFKEMNIFRQITANNINLEEYPFTKELAMEAYIMENESIMKLDKDEFSEPSVIDAEIALKEGRASGDGRIDILAQYSANTFAIVELKLNEINCETLNQLTDYLKQRNKLQKYLPENSDKKESTSWVGILIGRTICPKLKEIIESKGVIEIDGTEIPIAAITINRYRGIEHKEIFVVTDTYFKEPNTKDFTKYDLFYNDKKINDKPLSKGALATEVIRHYVGQNSPITFDKLREVFPKKLQGHLHCFDTKEVAVQKRANSNNRAYHRFGNEIKLEDATILVSNGWALENINWFINGRDNKKGAKDHGYKIEYSRLR